MSLFKSTTKKIPITFKEQIVEFNHMYGLRVAAVPSIPENLSSPYKINGRMIELHKILLDEVREVCDIMEAAERGATDTELLTMLADWLGDIQIYCASEMAKFGLDNETVLSIIMASNMSKLGKDGKPIIEAGKVMKGPDYWKPEPMLAMYIEAAIAQARFKETPTQ